MPELPDVVVYLEALARRIRGAPLEDLRLASPFVLRSVEPTREQLRGRRVIELARLGKRLVWELEDEHFVVIHLMIAGRLRWGARGSRPPGRIGLAAFDVPGGSVLLTEAGSKRRASIHLVRGREALQAFERGGLEPLEADAEAFVERLRLESHTLKRALTDPRLFSGIGNAYSDEILHRARLSPLQLSGRLSDEEAARLHRATREVLIEWTERLRRDAGTAFPTGSPPSGKAWRCTAASGSRVPSAAHRSSGSGTPTTRPTIAPPARPGDGFSPTGRCPGC